MFNHLFRADQFVGKDSPRRHCRKFYLIFLLIALVAATPFPASGAGLVGYWNFDQRIGSMATDLSGNNNTGVLMNGPLWTTGKLAGGLSFDGVDDVVEVEHSASLDITRELTVSAWIYNQEKHDPLLPEPEYHIIAAKGWAPDVGGSWTLAWDKKTDALFFCVRRRNDNDSQCASFDFGNLTTNWHLVTGVFNNHGRIKLYVDGALAAGPVDLGTERINTNTEPVYVGSLPSSTPDQMFTWHGYIDDVRIYNAALNAVAIASLYQEDAAILSSYSPSSKRNFDFTIANSGNVSTSQGSTVSTNINTVLTSSSSKFVSFSVSGLPTNATSSFSSSSCSPSCSTVLTVRTNSSTPVGTYTINVTGKAGGVTKSTSFNLSISQATIPTVAAPTITPGSGSFIGAVSVSMQDTTSGASIYYTTDGATPTQSSTPYTGTLSLTKSTTVKAKAFRSGYNPSSESRASLIVNQPFDFSLANSGNASIAAGSSASNKVTATLSSGSSQAVSFSVSGLPSSSVGSFSSTSCSPTCSTVLNIVTSGSTPAGNYTIVVTSTGGSVTRSTNFILSVTATVSLVVATPTITPNGGSFSGSLSVSMATATSGASIYYTTDGSTPTQSSKLYSGAMTLTSSTGLKTKAFKSGYNPSAEASASFTNTSSSTGKVYYVAKTGSDRNTCAQAQSLSTPKLTVGAGIACMAGGDTLKIRAGTYAETRTTPPSGSSWSNATTIARYGEDVVVFGTPNPIRTFNTTLKYLIIDGIIFDGINDTTLRAPLISIGQGPTHIRFQNVEIKNAYGDGVLVSDPSEYSPTDTFLEFINCKVHDNGREPLSQYSPGHNGLYITTGRNLIVGGEYYNNLRAGIRIFTSVTTARGNNNTITGALIHNNGWNAPSGAGIYVGDDNQLIHNNIIYDNNGRGINIAYKSPVAPTVDSNTVYNNNEGIFVSSTTSGAIIQNNNVYQNASGNIVNNGIGTILLNNR